MLIRPCKSSSSICLGYNFIKIYNKRINNFVLISIYFGWPLWSPARRRPPGTGTPGPAVASHPPAQLSSSISRGSQRDVVYLVWPIGAIVYEPKCGGKGGVAGPQPMSTAVHRSPNKLWRSNSIFNLWVYGIQENQMNCLAVSIGKKRKRILSPLQYMYFKGIVSWDQYFFKFL